MKISINDFKRQQGQEVAVQENFVVTLSEANGAKPLQQAHVNMQCLFEQDKLYITGSVALPLQATCDRCGADVAIRLCADLADVLSAESDTDVDEVGQEFDTQEFAREKLLLALPMKILCNEKCKGLCPICGCNQNHQTCNCALCEEQTRAKAFDILKKLK